MPPQPLTLDEEKDLNLLENLKDYPHHFLYKDFLYLKDKNWADDNRKNGYIGAPYHLTQAGKERLHSLVDKKQAWDYRRLSPRQRTHLRLLREGKPQPQDYEEVRYLAEKYFVDADCLEDTSFANRGKVIEVVWRGITVAGRDYLEELEQQVANTNAGQDGSEPQPAAQRTVTQAAPVQAELWHERSTGRATIFWYSVGTAASLTAALLAAYLLGLFQ